jgi:predicted MFS family arabinose efflux permease
LLGGIGFAAFSLFWATMAFLLGDTEHHFDSSVIGAFGLLGAAGAVAANRVGRVRAPGRAGPTATAVAVLAASFAVLYFAPWSLVALGVGVVVLDIAVQGLHVLNQRLIYDALPQARSRANSAYMTCYFLGGALGSAAGTFAWNHYGWTGVCVAGLVLVAPAVPLVAFAAAAARRETDW